MFRTQEDIRALEFSCAHSGKHTHSEYACVSTDTLLCWTDGGIRQDFISAVEVRGELQRLSLLSLPLVGEQNTPARCFT